MSRIMKRRRKKYAVYLEERSMKHDQLLHTTYTKWERILSKLPSCHDFFLERKALRLAGGADNVPDNAIQTAPEPSVPENPGSFETSTQEPPPGPSTTPDVLPESTGDQKVDELIDYIIQNLQEAGKALATLTENHEQDLKLMLQNITTHLQNWTTDVQTKIDSASDELNELRKQLTTRHTQVEELKVKLAESEMTRMTYEKTLIESGLKTTTGTDPSYSSVHIPTAPASMGIPSGPGSMHTVMGSVPGSVHAAMGPSAPGSAYMAMGPSAPGSVHAAMGPSVPGSVHAAMGSSAPGSVYTAGMPSVPGSVHLGIGATSAAGSLHAASLQPVASQLAAPGMAPSAIPSQLSGQLPPGAIASRVSGLPTAPAIEIQGAVPSGLHAGPMGPMAPGVMVGPPGMDVPTIPIEQLPGYDPSLPMPDSYITSAEREAGLTRRETELEAELDRLRRENERILKERADYENAIQRALLRGVSSLNVETLKVLKNPPLSCCAPCAPCNQPTESITATNETCAKPRENWLQRDRSNLPSKFDETCRRKEKPRGCSKKPVSTVCYSPEVAKKPSQSSMVFLLPKKTTEDTCIAFPRFCARSTSISTKSVPAVCLDEKYRKKSRSRDRNLCSRKSQKDINRDIYHPSGRDGTRTLNCADIFTVAARRDNQESRRCDPCGRTRRTFD